MFAAENIAPLKELLQSRRMTVAELSAAVGSDRQHIGRILNGRRRPSARLRQRIAEYLGVDEADAFPEATLAVTVEMRIRELVDTAPPLSEQQRARLAALLHPGSAA